MHSYPALGACPFCNWPFKAADALTNHMEKIHPNLPEQPRKRKRVNSTSSQKETDATQESARATECINDQDLEQRLTELFPDFGILSSQRHDGNKLLREPYEEIIYDRNKDNRDSGPQQSDANKSAGDSTISFPPDREASKAIAAYPFIRQRDSTYNFFLPFRNALDFKLARSFYTAHVPKARINEFFKDGFLGAKTDAAGLPLAPILPTRFSFHSAYGLYQKLDDMMMDPAWKNGFVDFRLAKGTKFWYRDILQVLKYLLRWKSFA